MTDGHIVSEVHLELIRTSKMGPLTIFTKSSTADL